MSNRHPVDRLADVRAQIKALKAIEDDLVVEVSRLIGDNVSILGHDYVAVQTLSARKGAFDEAKLKAKGLNPVDFRKPDVSVLSIKVSPVAQEVAA
jgi:hypothetical protein